MDEVRLAKASVHVLSVVRGLPSEASAVARAIDLLSPSMIGLSIAPEELEALRSYPGGPAPPENFEEEVYMAGLAAWEEPVKPAPCFTEALRLADAHRIPVEGLDMDETTYTDAYTSAVSTMELILHGRAEARLRHRKFRAKTPEEFVREWDAVVNHAAGFARLQREREAHMATRLRDRAERFRRVLAVVECERAPGVLSALRRDAGPTTGR
jgi:hypothetical protein